jgi:hypothetical protein
MQIRARFLMFFFLLDHYYAGIGSGGLIFN